MSLEPPKTHIWLLEDNHVFAKQIRRLLNSEADFVCSHHFISAADLFGELKFTTIHPAILLLDLGLPRRDGLDVLREIRSVLPDTKVLVLTSSDDREKVYRAICNGASGYLLKTADPEEIINGIRDILKGDSALSSSIAKMILEGFARHGTVEHIKPLTTRESDVLQHLVRGLLKKEIAAALSISQHTVDMHLRSVYRKLQVRTQTEAVSKALRQGLV